MSRKRKTQKGNRKAVPDKSCLWCNEEYSGDHRCPILAISQVCGAGVLVKDAWCSLYDRHQLGDPQVWDHGPNGSHVLKHTVNALFCVSEWSTCTALATQVVETGLKALLALERTDGNWMQSEHSLLPIYKKLSQTTLRQLDGVHESLHGNEAFWDGSQHGVRHICSRFNKAYSQHRYLEDVVGNRTTVLQRGKLESPHPLFMLMDSLAFHISETHLEGILRKSIEFPFGWWKGHVPRG